MKSFTILWIIIICKLEGACAYHGSSPTADFELLPRSCCDCSNMGVTVKLSFWK